MTIHTWKNYTFNKGIIFLNNTISIYENEVIIIKIKGGLDMKKIKILLIIALSMSILIGCGKVVKVMAKIAIVKKNQR